MCRNEFEREHLKKSKLCEENQKICNHCHEKLKIKYNAILCRDCFCFVKEKEGYNLDEITNTV